ncbi:MAG: SLBB domain-containing protein [Sphingobacteriia bacterium]
MKKNSGLKIVQLRNYIYLCFVIVFMFLISSVNVKAQNSGETNQRSVSDTQIVSYQKLKNDVRSNSGNANNGNKIKEPTAEELRVKELEKKLFGYNIFHNKSVKFEPNLNMATPKGYVIGPKDELVLQVFGVAQNKYDVIVSNEGRISIPDIGVAQIGGLTIEAVQSLLTQKMSIRYAGMRGSNPNTFLQVSLSNIRTIKVNMVGEIGLPGTYSLPSYINVFNALFAAGGPTIKGTFRAVQVYRNNRQVAEIDLYDYIVNGKINQNIRLEDNDVILVRPSSSIVEIVGEVRIAGFFEMKPKETFKDLLKYVGGFSENAYKELVSIKRKGVTENQVFDIFSSQFSNAIIYDGDVISVSPIQDKISNRVIITGSVMRPGVFEWSKGLRIRDLIQKAGGYKGDAFLKNILVYRTKFDLTQEVINVDLSKNDLLDTVNNILLNKEDAVSIKSVIDLREEYYVQISGEINNIGTYPLLDSMSLYDLILQAGGGKYSASGSYIEIARRSLSDPSKIADIIPVNNKNSMLSLDSLKIVLLKPFDHVFIRSTPGYYTPYSVLVKGEVKLPGEYVVDKKEMRVSDLVKRAGGLTKFAYLDGSTLLRRTKSFIAKSESEIENQKLNSIKQNVNKDNLIANIETNKNLNKRIDNKISENETSIELEKKQKEDELSKQIIIKDNAQLKGKKNNTEPEKEQELVAINLTKIMAEPGSSNDLILKEGDVLEIPELLETVSIKGGVLFPVSVKFDDNLGFKDYIYRSGGYASQADKKRAYVIQANGKVEVVKRYILFKKYPKVLPGAQIFVPVNTVEKPPFSYEKGLALLTSTLTLIFLLRTL